MGVFPRTRASMCRWHPTQQTGRSTSGRWRNRRSSKATCASLSPPPRLAWASTSVTSAGCALPAFSCCLITPAQQHRRQRAERCGAQTGSAFASAVGKAASQDECVKQLREAAQVINWGPPASLQMYYQMVGRAGRDGLPARCLLFWSKTGISTRRFLHQRDAARCASTSLPPFHSGGPTRTSYTRAGGGHVPPRHLCGTPGLDAWRFPIEHRACVTAHAFLCRCSALVTPWREPRHTRQGVRSVQWHCGQRRRGSV